MAFEWARWKIQFEDAIGLNQTKCAPTYHLDNDQCQAKANMCENIVKFSIFRSDKFRHSCYFSSALGFSPVRLLILQPWAVCLFLQRLISINALQCVLKPTLFRDKHPLNSKNLKSRFTSLYWYCLMKFFYITTLHVSFFCVFS